jgi:hypothetical protein
LCLNAGLMALYPFQCGECKAMSEEWHPMSAAPLLGSPAKGDCPCGARPVRVLTAQVSVRVPKTSFPVLQYKHLKGAETVNGHPQITSKRHLNEVCALNNLHVDRDVPVEV